MTHAPDHDAAEDGTGTLGRQPRRRRTGRRGVEQLPVWQEMVLLLGIALVLAIVIKAFLMQAFYIPSASMNDTLVENDRILVQKVSYWGGGAPHRGDIVVFADPGGWLGAAETQAAGQPGRPRSSSCSASTRPAVTW